MKKLLVALMLLAATSAQAAAPFGSKKVLTSVSVTTCTSIQSTGNGMLIGVVNTGPAQTVFLTLYDEGASPTCAAADVIYGDGTSLTLGAGQSIMLNIPVSLGLAYKLSGALSSNVVITKQ